MVKQIITNKIHRSVYMLHACMKLPLGIQVVTLINAGGPGNERSLFIAFTTKV